MKDLVNADFSRRVAIVTDELPWVPSPQPGVERRILDRVGGEVARATSVVRYAPSSVFPPHEHGLGEEFIVLDGIFSDEHGDYPAGTYVRNPPGSRHSPRTAGGCTIFVKLRQMALTERERVVVYTGPACWEEGDVKGHARLVLHGAPDRGEWVTLERLAAGTNLAGIVRPGGQEMFVLTGGLEDEYGKYQAGTWIRNPPGYRERLRSERGATYWVKRGHLPPAS